MAGRKVKRGLDYFPFDVNLFNDIKVRKLIKYQGGKSFSVFAYLLCLIYKDGYYIKWDKELPFVISEATGCDEAYVIEVFNCCLKVGLFDPEIFTEHHVVTSKGIQERYSDIANLLGRKAIVKEFIIIPWGEMPINEEEIGIDSGLMQQRKGKEKKGKEKEENSNSQNDSFCHKPSECDIGSFELPEIIAESIVEVFAITKKQKIIPDQVKALFEVFKKIHFTGRKYYQDEGDVNTHFLNWVKYQKIEYAKTVTNNTGLGAKNGGFDILAESLKADMAKFGYGEPRGS